VQSVSERLVEVEHDSDQITHDLYHKINTSFITPFDREDIYRLGSRLDDVMDHLEAVGSLLYLYGLTRLPALPREMHDLIVVLDNQAKVTTEAMPRLRTMKNLEDYWIETNRLENEGDRSYRMLLVRLFSGEYDALTVLKMKEVADELEAACDAFEHVANTVETIAVKES
jgi:predicted phosphate transport protein (TIGR00153 family)